MSRWLPKRKCCQRRSHDWKIRNGVRM